jgi:hypothetical protein
MNRFDLEDAIYLAWRTSDDLDMLFKHHGDHPVPMTEDEVSNMIHGIKQLHDMRMESLWTVFKKEFKLDEYCTDPEALAERKRVLKVIDKATEEPKKKGKKNVPKT